MEDIKMTNEERITRAQALFMGSIYFHNYGGFSKEEFIKKMEDEFQYLKFESYSGSISGSASLESPVITLYAQSGHELSSIDFTSNIKYYRSTILHELIHMFLRKRNRDGEVTSSGLLKIIPLDKEFQKYLQTSKINSFLLKINFITLPLFKTVLSEEEFGRGANEGYAEWFRATILKNKENATYKKLTSVFFEIQEKLEKQNLNAVSIMKEFSEGNYDSIFTILNMSKERGILFVRYLDYLYVKEYEKEKIQEYLENKKLQKELEKVARQDKLTDSMNKKLEDVRNFCLEIENKYRKITGKVLTESQIYFYLNKLFNYNSNMSIEIHYLLHSVLENSFSNSLEDDFFYSKKLFQNVLVDSRISAMFFSDTIQNYINLKISQMDLLRLKIMSDLQNAIDKKRAKNSISKLKLKKIRKGIKISKVNSKKIVNTVLLSFLIAALFSKKYVGDNTEFLKEEKWIQMENFREKLNSFNDDVLQYPFDVWEDKGIMDKYFPNGICLDKGQDVYRSSYDTASVPMNYAYQNLDCDSVRIIKDEEIIEKGTLEDIDSFYKKANLLGANVRLKLVKKKCRWNFRICCLARFTRCNRLF